MLYQPTEVFKNHKIMYLINYTLDSVNHVLHAHLNFSSDTEHCIRRARLRNIENWNKADPQILLTHCTARECKKIVFLLYAWIREIACAK